ncbi:MAG TPA: hypothetical protein VG899_12480 [Mycobacteriales bacterium]|nr:hypothetical protein [Mycobacteriales bacterium]
MNGSELRAAIDAEITCVREQLVTAEDSGLDGLTLRRWIRCLQFLREQIPAKRDDPDIPAE